jgi:RloB-like protein
MARVLKIDNALKKQFANNLNKKKKGKVLTTYFLIVCEGEKTEPNYFKSFPIKVGKFIFDIKFDGRGISTLKVVKKAIELRDESAQKFDRVWAVFDRDSFKANSFNSAILKAKANNIECAWSNEAFELWYLLHFHNRVTAMNRNEYKKSIEDSINAKINGKKKKFKYQKNSNEMFDILGKYGNEELAIKWAKELYENLVGEQFAEYNPCTNVYKLVLELTGKSEELNAEVSANFIRGL